jgi:hypothetical protein
MNPRRSISRSGRGTQDKKNGMIFRLCRLNERCLI